MLRPVMYRQMHYHRQYCAWKFAENLMCMETVCSFTAVEFNYPSGYQTCLCITYIPTPAHQQIIWITNVGDGNFKAGMCSASFTVCVICTVHVYLHFLRLSSPVLLVLAVSVDHVQYIVSSNLLVMEITNRSVCKQFHNAMQPTF